MAFLVRLLPLLLVLATHTLFSRAANCPGPDTFGHVCVELTGCSQLLNSPTTIDVETPGCLEQSLATSQTLYGTTSSVVGIDEDGFVIVHPDACSATHPRVAVFDTEATFDSSIRDSGDVTIDNVGGGVTAITYTQAQHYYFFTSDLDEVGGQILLTPVPELVIANLFDGMGDSEGDLQVGIDSGSDNLEDYEDNTRCTAYMKVSDAQNYIDGGNDLTFLDDLVSGGFKSQPFVDAGLVFPTPTPTPIPTPAPGPEVVSVEVLENGVVVAIIEYFQVRRTFVFRIELDSETDLSEEDLVLVNLILRELRNVDDDRRASGTVFEVEADALCDGAVSLCVSGMCATAHFAGCLAQIGRDGCGV